MAHFLILNSHFSILLALLLLVACSGRQSERMHDELLRAREMNKEYVDFTTDSVMKEVWVKCLSPRPVFCTIHFEYLFIIHNFKVEKIRFRK